MPKNNDLWKDRRAVQKAFDADPQHAYNTIAKVLTPEQAEIVEAALCPQPTDEEVRAKLQHARAVLVSCGVDTASVDAKLETLKGGEPDGQEGKAQR